LRWLGLALVVVHALVLVAHDAAHRELGVMLAPWQQAFVYPVIVAAPLLAAVLLFTRFRRAGFALLAVAMIGAFAFGVYHHYVGISPDHVDHLPPGDAQPAFRFTALVMAAVEAFGAVLATWGYRASARREPPSPL